MPRDKRNTSRRLPCQAGTTRSQQEGDHDGRSLDRVSVHSSQRQVASIDRRCERYPEA
jgi:hypothetical protein